MILPAFANPSTASPADSPSPRVQPVNLADRLSDQGFQRLMDQSSRRDDRRSASETSRDEPKAHETQPSRGGSEVEETDARDTPQDSKASPADERKPQDTSTASSEDRGGQDVANDDAESPPDAVTSGENAEDAPGGDDSQAAEILAKLTGDAVASVTPQAFSTASTGDVAAAAQAAAGSAPGAAGTRRDKVAGPQLSNAQDVQAASLAAQTSGGAAAAAAATSGEGSSDAQDGSTPSGQATADAATKPTTAASVTFFREASPVAAPSVVTPDAAALSASGQGSSVQPAGANAAGGASVVPPQTPPGSGTGESDNDRLNAARLGRALNTAVNQKGGGVTLRLTPPEIGTVRIQLQITGTSVSARIHTETAAGQQLLNQQLGQLRTSLESQGLQVDRVTVQPMQHSQAGSQSQNDSDSSQDGRSRQQHHGQQSGSRSQSNGRDDSSQTPRFSFDDLLTGAST